MHNRGGEGGGGGVYDISIESYSNTEYSYLLAQLEPQRNELNVSVDWTRCGAVLLWYSDSALYTNFLLLRSLKR